MSYPRGDYPFNNSPEEIIIHHSATGDGFVLEDFDAIRRYHINKGWDDIGYHWIIEYSNGKANLRQGRPMYSNGAHVKEQHMNFKSIGICVVGHFDKYGLDKSKYDMLVNLIKFIRSIYGDLPVRTHNYYAPYKTCPGTQFPMDKLRKDIGDDVKEEKHETTYEVIGNTYVITTHPENIEIKILGDSLHSAGVNGMNGSWFNREKPSLKCSTWHIAINEGKFIRSNIHWKNYPRGIILYYYDGRIEVKRVTSISKSEVKKIKWGISGGMLTPDYNPNLEGYTYPFNDVLRYANHSGIGYKNGKIVLFMKPSCKMTRFVQSAKNLELDGAIFVDGGGSSQIRYKGKGYKSNRDINTAICLKEV